MKDTATRQNSNPILSMTDHPISTISSRCDFAGHAPATAGNVISLPPPGSTFSLFATAQKSTPCGHLTLSGLVDGIKDGLWRTEVEACRRALHKGGQGAYKAVRASVPAVSLSAYLKHRRGKTTLEQKGAIHSGLLQLDFDAKDHPRMTVEKIWQVAIAAPFVAACFRSLSGEGVKAVALCPASFETHRGSWLAAEAYFKEHGLSLDPATKDPVRLCFVSHDPRALFWDEATEIEPHPAPDKNTDGDPSNGTEDPKHVHRVLASLAEKIGPYQDHNTWIHICACAKDAVGADAAGEIVDEYFPPEEPHHESAADVMDSLPYGAWLSLRKYGIEPADYLRLLPDSKEVEEPARKRLADYLVNHSDTLGMSWQEIDALRPPYIIDGFLRQGEVLLLGAESKSRKSWLAQDAGFAVAAGLPWLADKSGAHGFATAQARVHVFDLELSPAEMRYRLAKARGNRFADAPEDAAAMTARIAAYSFDGQNVKDIMEHFEELKATVAPGDLVIVDCLYRLCPDGNEVAPLAAILETVKRFASETQAGVIVVDHFRKAGDDKARNRFAGSFVKQASASTLVAIEVTADDVLVLNIDARTFHGCNKVHARFNPDTYAFNRLPEIEVEKAKQESKRGEAERWLLRLWNGRPEDSAVIAADAVERWGIKRQGAVPRLEKLVSRKWLTETKVGPGKATEWTLAPAGVAVVKPDREDL
jgi:hypothetical protein